MFMMTHILLLLFSGCPLGQYMDVMSTKLCRHCEIGTYRDAFSGDLCVQCPDNLLTPETGAISAAQCTESESRFQ